MIRSSEMVGCSFCGKSKDQVERLIQGGRTATGELPPVFICDQCIRLCAHIIGEPVPEPRHDELYLPLTDWAEIEIDGERYRWSSARVTMSEHGVSGRSRRCERCSSNVSRERSPVDAQGNAAHITVPSPKLTQ